VGVGATWGGSLKRLKLIPVLCLVLFATACSDSEPAYSKPRFTAVKKMAEIPPGVMKALVDLCHQCTFADIGEDFEQTDVARDASLSTHGISWAGYSGSKWVIRYDHGGIGFHSHELTFETMPSVRVVAIGGNSCDLSDMKDCEF
jgi:hypothetical protein